METLFLNDIDSMVQNKAIERIITPMTIQLCHLLISVERKDVKNEAFASLEKVALELDNACEEFVQVATRLAGDSEEEWLREEMKPLAESLIFSGRNITLVTQKLLLQPEYQCHWEELVIMAQQIVVDTSKVLLLEDTAMVRKVVRAVERCLTCLDRLEAAEDATSLRGPFADLGAALVHLGRLTARLRGDERLGRARRLLRCRAPALLAAARGHLRHPHDAQQAASGRRIFAQTREILGELRAGLKAGAGTAAARSGNGGLAGRLRRLSHLLAAPGPVRCGRLDAPLAAAVWLCLRLAAGFAPRERMRVVSRCARLLELRGAARGPDVASQAECEALRAAADALALSVRAGLLRQILDTFTDTHSPLQRLVHAALATSTGSPPCDGKALWKSLQLFLDAFLDQANRMVRVARLVLLYCPRLQTVRDLEAAVAGFWRLVVRVKQLFPQSPQERGPDWSPATLQALLEAWAQTSEQLSACFDAVLNIPEFLTMSIQEMIKHLHFFTWALRSGDSREFSRAVVYLQGRATHIVQVMRRYVGQGRDPIFRNGLKVLIQQLEQSSLLLGAATERKMSGVSSQDTDAFSTMAKHLICSAQQVQEGLNGTNHPDILSPLRGQVYRFDLAKTLAPTLQHYIILEMKGPRVPELDKRDPGTFLLPKQQPSCWLIRDTCVQGRGCPLPATSKLILTVENQSHQAVTSARTCVSDQDETVDAALVALAGEEPWGLERMAGSCEFSTLAPSNIDLIRGHSTNARCDRLLEVALQLSERTKETRQGLVARAGDWYSLCQQLFCHNPTPDLTGSMVAFMELHQSLASMVQLAATSVPMNLDEKDPDSLGHSGVFFQMQDQLEKAEIHATQLLDKILSSNGLQAPKLWEGNIENSCLQWSVAVHDLIQFMERLNRRQGLFLLPLRQAVKDQQGLQERLDQAVDISQRLKEAAKLSSLLCENEQVKGEVSFLCREVHILRDALLDVAHILASSCKPSPSLSTRFELLCLELTLRVKALTGHLSSINADYECAFQDAVYPIFSVCKNPQPGTESPLESMVSSIQAVQAIIAGGQESGPLREDLLVAVENILILTKEVAQRVPVLEEHPEEWQLHMLDWLRWEWAAKAHHAVTQLQAWKGGHSKACRLLVQCLNPRGKPPRTPEQDLVQFLPHCDEDAAEATAGGSVDSQSALPTGSLESSVGTSPGELITTSSAAADIGMHPTGSLSLPPGCPARQHAEMDQPVLEDGSADGENRITKITQEMAQEVFLMTQSLKKRGPVLTKDQIITSARKIAAAGENLTRLMGIIAKNCVDGSCSRELVCVLQQIQTMSSQLRILSRVKASLARSKSSEELLVENAQQLLQAVSRTVRAAEAASLRGLKQPSPDPEELEVAALCIQWRRKLIRHRQQESTNVDCDELGLRKASKRKPPALVAMGPE